MDFVYSSDPSQAAKIRAAWVGQGVARPIAVEHSGRWGCFAATDTPYWGYAPEIVDGQLVCVVGDPLVSGLAVSERSGAARTTAVARNWKRDAASVEPNHPAALFRIEDNQSVSIVTDAWGAVPIFWGLFDDALYVATSPDLIALCVEAQTDRLSVLEFLATTQLSFPNTLYTDIWQVAPASHVSLNGEGVASSQRYWSPPLPVPGRSVPQWADVLHQSIVGTYALMAAELGRKGSATLSAGLDTRYLIGLATRDKLLELDAVTIAPIRNQEFWIAKRAARLLEVEHKAVHPPPGGYGARMLENAPFIPSHIDREHAHFSNKALGEIKAPFLLGGYMADTILNCGDPFYTLRRHALQARNIPSNGARWMRTTFGATLGANDADAISRRWQHSDELLGLTVQHEPGLVTAYPATRQGHIAHFQAARREYPMYEPFMTRAVLGLGFELPIELKQASPKQDFYAPYLDGLLSGMLAPGASDRLSKRWQKRLNGVPMEKRPEWAKLTSAWHSAWGLTHDTYVRELADSLKRIRRRYKGDYTTVPRQLCYQVAGAEDITTHRATPERTSKPMARSADHANSEPSLCVFTTLVGNYESLNEQPVATRSAVPFICLTDDPDLRSDAWEIRQVTPLFAVDPIRSQRGVKIAPYRHLPEFDCSLYIDNSVLLTEPPEALFALFDREGGFALPEHGFRKSVLDEFLAVVEESCDDPSRVFEQLNHYSLECPDVLDEKPFWTGLMIRDHRNPAVKELMDYWHAHVLRFSRRDQLSLNWAARRAGIRPQILPLGTHLSDFHSWPHTASRDKRRRSALVKAAQVPSVAGLRAVELEMQADKKNLAEQKAATEAALLALEAEKTGHMAAQQRLAECETRLARQKTQIEAMSSSTSWLLTAPLRAAVNLFRHSPQPQQPLPLPTDAAPSPSMGFHVSPSDIRGRQLQLHDGDLNPPTLQIWRRLVSEYAWTHIVDVGANYGEMLVGVQLPEDTKIIAFEPNPLIAPYLEWNLAQRGVGAEVVQIAVSDHVGEAQLVVDRSWSGLSRLDDQGADSDPSRETVISVPTTTVSAFLGEAAALAKMSLLIKVDVEGHEAKVLVGVLELLDQLENFAALVEVLHVPPTDLAWMIEHFDVELLLKSSQLTPFVPLVPPSAEGLGAALADPRYYTQDIILRRKRRD